MNCVLARTNSRLANSQQIDSVTLYNLQSMLWTIYGFHWLWTIGHSEVIKPNLLHNIYYYHQPRCKKIHSLWSTAGGPQPLERSTDNGSKFKLAGAPEIIANKIHTRNSVAPARGNQPARNDDRGSVLQPVPMSGSNKADCPTTFTFGRSGRVSPRLVTVPSASIRYGYSIK